MVSAMVGDAVLPPCPCSLGIHPWQVSGGDSGIVVGNMTLAEALHEVDTAEVDAIGEIGLDYARPVPRSFQKEVFEAQLAIAHERGLPVVIHCVRAFEPVMELLVEYGMAARSVFHGFVGSRQQAMRAVTAGCSLSFGVRSFASPKTVEAMLTVPLSKFFLETDDMAIHIAEIYAGAARLMPETDIEGLKKAAYINYMELFGK